MKSLTKNTSLLTYSLGFGISLVLTLLAYFAVTDNWFASTGLLVFVVTLALVQLIAQLILFLHLGSESKPRWNLYALLFAIMVIVIIVFGSLWIMYNLDYHHGNHNLSPEEIIKDEGFEPKYP